MALLFGKAEIVDVIRFRDCLVTERISYRASFQIRLSEVLGGCFQVEAIENNQIRAAQQFAVRWDRLKRMWVDAFRDDAGDIRFIAGNVFRDACDRRDCSDDTQFLPAGRRTRLFSPAGQEEQEKGHKQPCGKSMAHKITRPWIRQRSPDFLLAKNLNVLESGVAQPLRSCQWAIPRSFFD